MLIFSLIIASLSQELVQIQSLWRHGARTPIFCNWNCVYFKTNKMLDGYLTPTGMRQHYVLGNWFRETYTGEGKLLSTTFKQEEIQIYATDVNRTIMSAMSNLQGMYPETTGPNIFDGVGNDYLLPPNKFTQLPDVPQGGALPYKIQAVPIHMREQLNDWILRGYGTPTCAKAAAWQVSNQKTDLANKVGVYCKDLILKFANQMNLDPSMLTIFNLSDYQDTFTSSVYNNYPLPDLSDDVKKGLEELYSLAIGLKLYQTWDQIRLMSQPFFENLLTNMENQMNGLPTYKYHIFSAHDVTVQLMAMALNLTSAQCMAQVFMQEPVENKNCIYTYPGYASNMVFELFKNPTQTYSVKLRYNGTYVNLCDGTKPTCDYTEFKARLQSQSLNFEEGCLIKTSTDITQTKVPVWMLTFSIILTIILTATCIFSLWLLKQLKQKLSKTNLLADDQQNSAVNKV